MPYFLGIFKNKDRGGYHGLLEALLLPGHPPQYLEEVLLSLCTGVSFSAADGVDGTSLGIFEGASTGRSDEPETISELVSDELSPE